MNDHHVFTRDANHPEIFHMLVCNIDQWEAVELTASLRSKFSLSANFSRAESLHSDGHFGVIRFVKKRPIIWMLGVTEEEAEFSEFENDNVDAFNAEPLFESIAAAKAWIKSRSEGAEL